MYPDNNWYGHKFIYREYCKLDKDLPIFGSLQHGCHWDLYAEIFQDLGKKKFQQYIPHFCWDAQTLKILKKRGIKNVYSIGAPFLYLLKINKFEVKFYKKNKKSGTLYFPDHSTFEENIQEQKTEFIVKTIENNNDGPYTVCFYYSDLTKQNISYYQKKKWNIVCCGDREDNFMLFKIFKLIQDNEKCIFSSFGTAMFYSMIQKKKTQIIQGLVKREITDEIYKSSVFFDYHKKKFPSLFKNHIDLDQGYNYAKKILGFESLKNPDELKNILGWKSLFKKTVGFFVTKYIDIKYSKNLRYGKKLEKKYKKKLKNSY